MTKHILAAIGVRESDATLALAIERARESHAQLTAVHVVDRMPWWATSSLDSDCGAMVARVEEQAQQIAEHSLQIMRDADIEDACMTIDLPRARSMRI